MSDSAVLTKLSRSEAEDFLFHEAALLDEWQMDDWLGLFAEGATYEVPPANAMDGVTSDNSLFYIADDYERLGYRVARLNDKGAHAEYPHSRCVRMISNVRILSQSAAGCEVSSVFTTFRSKADVTDTYFGRHLHVLRQVDGTLKIVSKRTMLDMSSLRPQGRVSIIV
jgi:p-cumate 2,3-dioxygenase subunit beta